MVVAVSLMTQEGSTYIMYDILAYSLVASVEAYFGGVSPITTREYECRYSKVDV